VSGNFALGVAIVIAIVFLAWAMWPLVRRDAPASERGQRDVFSDALLTEKHYVYASILDLDADFKVGKLDAAEHQRLREELFREAARLLAQLDEIDSSAAARRA
jgi:hypothetical protein